MVFARKLENLKDLMGRHVKGNLEEKKAVELEMRKYGCNGPKETYKLIKQLMKDSEGL